MISPFAHTLSQKHLALTPFEIEIADLVKQGKSTKEIAKIFRLSTRTIEFHRQNIRKKLGLKHKKSNLRTYLLSIQ
jgi:DNA-binding CsgD family transcriptional regulator